MAEFVDYLLDRTPKWRGSLLVPCSDSALGAISRNKRILGAHFSVACPDWELTRRFLEKKNTRELARIAGVPCPWTYSIPSLEALEEHRGRIDFPCLVKPSTGHLYHAHFRAKMKRADTYEQAQRELAEALDLGFEMMLQEYIPGEDALGANYNSYWWEGAPLVEFTAQKVRNAPPALGSPRVVRSEYIPEIVDSGRRILRAARFSGFACTEFKRDPRDGRFKLLEVNARHNLSSELAIRCGIDFPYLQYVHLVEGRVPGPHTFKTGVYWIELVRDFAHTVRSHRIERHRVRDYARPYLARHVFAINRLRDPMPFLMQGTRSVQRTLRRRKARPSPAKALVPRRVPAPAPADPVAVSAKERKTPR